jgi:DNA helicase IV
VPHPELAAEQAYVDRAYSFLEEMRAAVERAPGTVDDEVVGAYLDAWAARRLATFEDAERGLCFGRLDVEGTTRPLYVGRRWVHDDAGEVAVASWQAPASRPFYTATPADPQRVTLRRRFRAEGRRLLDIADETLDGSTASVAGGDFLLEELDRSRDRHMRDIVATIQADQYALITRDPGTPLVVQGGPGTGKTAVGLHRASYLLFTHREELGRRGVLVVGPNPTFMEYVSHVLPTLGEENVDQRAAGDLVDGVTATRVEALDVAALKGDPRMALVVERAVAQLPEGEAGELVARLDGEYPRVREREVRALLEAVRADQGRGAAARERFRMELLRAFYRDYGRRLGASAVRSFEEIERALRSSGLLARVLDAAWPLTSPDRLVRRLLTSPTRLAEAAEGILDRREQRLLLRDRPRRAGDLDWSDHDLPLLDEAAALLEGPSPRYGHVIVDEAQDLTPMQLRMVGRRIRDGAYTLLGDIAQATGPVAHGEWESLLAQLQHGDEAEVAELRHAYRVPAEIMELALPLLDRIAPDVEPPLAFRTGGAAPRLRRVEQDALLPAALHEAAALAAEPGLLAVIAPAELLAELEPGSAFDETVALLPPSRAKGLEFDHVVVVEPAAIARDDDLRGLRELYVALTRPTRTLVVVHAEPLPLAPSSPK